MQLDANDPPTDEEEEVSDKTLHYPEEDSGDALQMTNEAEFQGLGNSYRVASKTATYASFATSVEGVVQDTSTLSTTPAPYTALCTGFDDEPRVSGRRMAEQKDEEDPQMAALLRVLGKSPTKSSRSHQLPANPF